MKTKIKTIFKTFILTLFILSVTGLVVMYIIYVPAQLVKYSVLVIPAIFIHKQIQKWTK